MSAYTHVPVGIVARFKDVAQGVVFDTVLPRAQIEDATDTGCCVALWMRIHDPDPHWVLVCVVSVGNVTPEQFLKYGFLAMEKGFRLSLNDDHIVSYESRGNEDDPYWTKRRYPGALRMDNAEVIVSTSGFAWKLDELTDHLIGSAFGWLSRERSQLAVEISRNADALNVLSAMLMF